MAEYRYVKGLSELQALFRQIPIDVGKKVLRTGAAAGANVVKAATKAAAPVGTHSIQRKGGAVTQPGNLQRAVILRFDRSQSNDAQSVYDVTLRAGKDQSKSAFYGPFVERGHRIVPRKGKGRPDSIRLRRKGATGFVPPHPFFEPAFNASRDRAIDAMVETMNAELEKVLPK